MRPQTDRQPRAPRAQRPPRRRNYDPDSLWPSHIGTGTYAEPGGVVATAHDLNWLINWPDALHALLWAAWRVVRRDGIRAIRIPANGSYSVNEVRAEWARLHVDSCILAMSNAGMTCLVGARQEKWARYVLGRLLAGEPVPAWEQKETHQ